MEPNDEQRIDAEEYQQPLEHPAEQDTAPLESTSEEKLTQDIRAEVSEFLRQGEPVPAGSRTELLTRAIQRWPDAPVNYLLRGEAYFDERDEDQAIQDFQKAAMLAEAQIDAVHWGYLYQSYIDRAREGLRRCGL